jgi:gliding motility-associated-like protein
MRFSTFFSLLIFFVNHLISNSLFAQNQADNWYFGNKAAVSFGTNPPTILTGSQMNAWEGVASISNAAGQLQFYTDGIKVWDRNNVQMPNGFGLNGDPSSAQSGVIVPKPGSSTIYYLFSVPSGGGSAFSPARLYYSVIDMTLNNGFGDVVASQKNINLSPNNRIQEKVCAVLHCNGEDVWVLAHEYGSNKFLVYLVDATNPPTLSSSPAMGESWAGNTNASIGILKASPDGKRIADTGNSNNKGQVLNFDNQTGTLSNPITLTNIGWAYGVEFSPDSRVLYMNSWYDLNPSKLIYQYNLLASNVDASRVNIPTQANVGSMQLAKDGAIYVARNTNDGGSANNGRKYLGKITNPNNHNGTVAACGWVELGLDLGGNESAPSNGQLSRYGLPNFLQSYFQEEVDFSFTDTCLNANTQFTAQIPQSYDSIRWNFATEGTSTIANPTFTFSAIGTYQVEMILYQACKIDTVIKPVNIVNSSINGFTGPLSVCQNEIATYSIDAVSGTSANWQITGGTINSGNGTNSINVTWGAGTSGTLNVSLSPGSTCSQSSYSITISNGGTPTFPTFGPYCVGETANALPTTSQNSITGTWNGTLSTVTAGTFNYTFTPSGGACFNPASVTIQVNETPTVSIQGPTDVCLGQGFNLSTAVSATGGNYLWAPEGQTTSIISSITPQSTTYSVVYTVNGCQSLPATHQINLLPTEPIFAGNDTIICSGASITLSGSGNFTSFSWSNLVVDGQAFVPTQTQTYIVSAINANGCNSTDAIQVAVQPLPTIDAGSAVVICQGQTVQFLATGAGANGTYTWENGIVNGSAVAVPASAYFTVIGTDAIGCTGIDSVFVDVVSSSIAAFTPSVTIGNATLTVDFTNQSSNATNYFWDFGNGLNNSSNSLATVSSSYESIGSYEVILVASNNGCSDTAKSIINVIPIAPPTLEIPNVFTVNGDNVNDVFSINSTNVAEFEMFILNRWGNTVAILKDVNEPWNGTTTNGTELTDGVYFYTYKLTGLNGDKKEGHGFITVIR